MVSTPPGDEVRDVVVVLLPASALKAFVTQREGPDRVQALISEPTAPTVHSTLRFP
jgi:hypothetical protein